MNLVLFRAVHIQDPESKFHDQVMDVWVEENKITDITPPGKVDRSDAQIIDLPAGTCLSPGWIDTMVQLSDPGYEYKESLTQLSQAALSGGFGSIICAPNTDPVVDNSQMVHSLKSRTKHLPITFHFCGAITEQAKGGDLAEVYDMHQAGAIGFSDGAHPLPNAGIFLRALQYMKSFNGLLIQTPSDVSLVGEGQMNEGIESTKLGMPGIPEMAEVIPTLRDIELYRYEPGRVYYSPMSSPQAIEALSEAQTNYPHISIGTHLYYLLLSDQDISGFDSVYKVFPPLRTPEQVQTLKQALKSGKINILSSGHCPQGIEEKQLEFRHAEPGMLGLQTFYPLAQAHLVNEGWTSLGDLIRLISHMPRKIFGLDPVSISNGSIADFTLFHPEKSWKLQAKNIPSRAKNSPWIDTELTGQVLGIYQKGRFHPVD